MFGLDEIAVVFVGFWYLFCGFSTVGGFLIFKRHYLKENEVKVDMGSNNLPICDGRLSWNQD